MSPTANDEDYAECTNFSVADESHKSAKAGDPYELYLRANLTDLADEIAEAGDFTGKTTFTVVEKS